MEEEGWSDTSINCYICITYPVIIESFTSILFLWFIAMMMLLVISLQDFWYWCLQVSLDLLIWCKVTDMWLQHSINMHETYQWWICVKDKNVFSKFHDIYSTLGHAQDISKAFPTKHILKKEKSWFSSQCMQLHLLIFICESFVYNFSHSNKITLRAFSGQIKRNNKKFLFCKEGKFIWWLMLSK